MSNLMLVEENSQLVILRPSEELLSNRSINEVVGGIQKLLDIRCLCKTNAWMVTDGTIRIQHQAEQETIKKVFGLKTQASSTNANQHKEPNQRA